MARKNISDLLICQIAHGMQDVQKSTSHLIARLMAASGECEKVCYAAAHRAADRGLIEYGVAIRWPWLTEKGQALVNAERGQMSPACP